GLLLPSTAAWPRFWPACCSVWVRSASSTRSRRSEPGGRDGPLSWLTNQQVERICLSVSAHVPLLAQRERDRLGAASDFELPENPLDVGRHRLRSDHEPLRDLLLSEAFRE